MFLINTFRLLLEYLDMGDPVYRCNACQALLWRDEAITGNPWLKKNVFSLCCSGGKVEVPRLNDPPDLLLHLYRGTHEAAKEFTDHIRQYNMMFSFTSMGAKVDKKVNNGRGPYIYKIHGQNYHTIGSLLPQPGHTPKFCQLYIYDTNNELNNRFSAFGYHLTHICFLIYIFTYVSV